MNKPYRAQSVSTGKIKGHKSTPGPELIPAVVVERAPVQVEGVVLTRAPVAAPAPVAAVAATTTSQLPRTGSSTMPLAEVGFGLVLLGVGALLQSRERTAEI